MTIIGGHQRLTVAIDLGYTEVPCAVVDVDKTREKALNIALNKITGAWDDQLLADLLKDLENVNFNLDITGFEAQVATEGSSLSPNTLVSMSDSFEQLLEDVLFNAGDENMPPFDLKIDEAYVNERLKGENKPMDIRKFIL